VTRLWAGRSGLNSWKGLGIFLLATTFRTALRPTQPIMKGVLRVLSPGEKRLVCDIYHSPPPTAAIVE
jgi:hypothetical protein